MDAEGKDDFSATALGSMALRLLGARTQPQCFRDWPSAAVPCTLPSQHVSGTEACGVAGGNSPHKHTPTMLEGRREPAGCCCSGYALLPGATLLTASLAPSLSSCLCPPVDPGAPSSIQQEPKWWLGGGLVCSLPSERGRERERSHRKYPTLTGCRPLQLIPLVGVPAPLGCPSGVGRVHLSKVQQCQVFG